MTREKKDFSLIFSRAGISLKIHATVELKSPIFIISILNHNFQAQVS